MDTKKLFEYVYLLESLRPSLSDAELVTAMKEPDAENKDVENIASFTITPSQEGMYLKFADKDGNQKKLVFLNPLVAKSLASELIGNLSALGYIEDDLLEVQEIDHSTLH